MLGVRPEHLVESNGGPSHLASRVEVLEPLGAEVHALGNVNGQPFTARLEPTTSVKVGDDVGLAVDLSHVHLFDKTSGLTIARG
ncbi:MAG: TOBE domain-containing protein [Myxococcales bacterium]|nr:TOBE domain-containing protein [Myxococcales bacterium]